MQCSYKDLIYLLASSSGKQKSIETFDPVDSVFTLLSVSLPADFLFECGSVAFVVANELVLITDRQQIVRWKIEKRGSEESLQHLVLGGDLGVSGRNGDF